MFLFPGNVPLRYQIQRSLRFRSSATAYLSGTPGATGNRKTWTLNFGLKRGILSATQTIFSASNGNGTGNGSAYFQIAVDANNCIDIIDYFGTDYGGPGVRSRRTTTAFYRDPLAHMFITLAVDTTQATATDRIKLYVGGVQVTSFSTNTSAAQNTDLMVNASGTPNYIGAILFGSIGNLLDGYLSEVNFIDGQALTPSSFGQIDPVTGQWTAKKYTGTYGVNGFYLDFKDASSTTNLCLDRSGNGNNWTPNNISLTAGATYDSMTDVPLAYGTTDRGNYCTWNPLDSKTNKPTNGNLRVGHNAGEATRATQFNSSGKWYFEFTLDVLGNVAGIGIATQDASLGGYVGSDSYGYGYASNGNKNNSGSGSSYGPSYTTVDVIGVAFDLDNGKIWFSKNGVWPASGDPVAGTNPAYSGISGSFAPMFGIDVSAGSGAGGSANFGQRPFAYTPPTGFKALHTGNMASDIVITSGVFVGNLNADGPDIWMNGAPETLTINGNAVTWGTHADKTAGGFKIRSASSSYNNTGSNTWVATILAPSLKSSFRYQLAKANP